MNYSSSISARLIRLCALVLQHIAALATLAGLEAQECLNYSIVTILLLVGIFISLLIGYIAALVAFMTLVVMKFGASYSFTIGSIALFHFIIAGILVLFLRSRAPHSAFKITLLEIKRDIEAFHQPPFSNHED